MDPDKISEIPIAASPQLENGFVRIANELFEAILKFPFSKRQLCVVLAVIRKTYGFQKTSDFISLTQLERLTSINRCHCSSTVNELVQMGVLLKELTGGPAQSIALQKNYKSWKVLPKQQPLPNRQLLPKQQQLLFRQREVTNSVTKSVTEMVNTKDNIKNNTQKTKKTLSCPHHLILDIYHEVLPEKRKHLSWDGVRAKNLASRWLWLSSNRDPRTGEYYFDNEHDGLAWFRRFFEYCRNSNFLMNDFRSFCLEWIVKKDKFHKIIEGAYHD